MSSLEFVTEAVKCIISCVREKRFIGFLYVICSPYFFFFWQEEIFPKVQLYIEYLFFIWAAYMLK